MKSSRALIVALLLAIFAAAAWFATRGHSTTVETVPARTGEAVELVYATGYVEAEEPVTVAARLTAPVARVLVEEGQRVRRGQALAILEDSEQRASAAQAAATERGASLDAQRKLALANKGWVTRAVRDQALASSAAARAAAAAASARLGQTVIRAGIDGVVLKRDVEPGDLAVPSRPLFLLGDPARLRITATADERDVPRLRVGQSALMSSDAFPGHIFKGHVREITPGGDPTQRAFRVRLALDDAGTPPPIGLTLEVNIVTARVPRALLVPASALVDGAVWTVDDGRARRRSVKSGIVGSEAVQIVAGIAAGAPVIAKPQAGIAEGQRVRVKDD